MTIDSVAGNSVSIQLQKKNIKNSKYNRTHSDVIAFFGNFKLPNRFIFIYLLRDTFTLK